MCSVVDGGIRHNMNWNYGLLPQTWEDPQVLNRDVENARGDNDPGMFTVPELRGLGKCSCA